MRAVKSGVDPIAGAPPPKPFWDPFMDESEQFWHVRSDIFLEIDQNGLDTINWLKIEEHLQYSDIYTPESSAPPSIFSLPTLIPSSMPTLIPSSVPTLIPSSMPTLIPSSMPILIPSSMLTYFSTHLTESLSTESPSNFFSRAPASGAIANHLCFVLLVILNYCS